jgi:tRNA(Ile)-lysidine synthase
VPPLRPMDNCNDPIRSDELERLFAPLAARLPCALAVSGGSDSTALMVLFADWLGRRGQDAARHTILTVDHGLRAQSAAEARSVAIAAAWLRYRHATLRWEGLKPPTGVQAAARRARYHLMGDYMRTHGIGLLLTAHTRDDQAETLLMRLARGSGLDGLCAMAPMAPFGDRGPDDANAWGSVLWIARPLLDVPKVCLRATLEARGIPWIEDPSNAAPAFERSRLRLARAQRDALGLTDSALALSVARLLRARRTLERVAEQFCDPDAGAVGIDPCGIVGIDRSRLRQAGEEIALRVLQKAIAAAGGAVERPGLSQIEPIVAAICRGGTPSPGRWTLARALVTAGEPTVSVERERGREPLPELSVAPGTIALWDGRFWVSVGSGFPGGSIQVRALGEAALRDLRRRDSVAAGVPARAAAMVPSFWHRAELIAAPSLQYWKAPHGRCGLSATFVGLKARSAADRPDAPESHEQ